MSSFASSGGEGCQIAAVYLVSLFGFVVWVGFVISWLLCHQTFASVYETSMPKPDLREA
jgi:hypothetical protein